jgi:hypothetical protein
MVRLICRSCLGSFRFFAAKYTVVDKEGEVADMGRWYVAAGLWREAADMGGFVAWCAAWNAVVGLGEKVSDMERFEVWFAARYVAAGVVELTAGMLTLEGSLEGRLTKVTQLEKFIVIKSYVWNLIPIFPAITDSSSAEEDALCKSWERSNRLSIIFMLISIANNIKSTLPKCDSAKEFFTTVEERFRSTNKSLVGTLMAELTTMKFDRTHGMHEHILEMTNQDAKFFFRFRFFIIMYS